MPHTLSSGFYQFLIRFNNKEKIDFKNRSFFLNTFTAIKLWILTN